MHIEDKKLFGIIICIIAGSIILFASLFYGKVDWNAIQGENLTDFGEGWQVATDNQVFPDVRFPAHIKNVVLGDTLILKKLLPTNLEGHTYIFFRASHQKVKVTIGNELAYSFGWDEQRLFGKSPACTWVLVPLSKEQCGATVTIELTGVYERYTNMVNPVYIGDKSSIIREIVSKRLGSVLICFILVIIGSGMIGTTAVLRNGRITESLQRLGILSVIIGIWSVCITNTLQILYGNVYFLLNLEFFMFNLLLPVFLWFLLSFQYYREQKWMNTFFWASILLFFVIEGLQLLGLADYMESIKITHVMITGEIGYIIVSGVRDLFLKKAGREAKILIFSVILLLLSAGIDMIRFYQVNVVDEGFYSRIGTLVFITLWGLEVILNMSKRFVNMAKTEALEVLAYADLMTGLKNRTAFEERLSAYENSSNPEDTYVITFDMNGLKGINDSFGHMKGDQAIITIARIIKENFEPLGVCYRTGGDEICVILAKTSFIKNEKVEEILKEIEEAITVASKELKLELSCAVGCSKASSQENRDIYQAYREADRRMYECKKKMKSEKI